MSLELQLFVVFILVGIAIGYFIYRSKNNKRDASCNENCKQCDLYNNCKLKK